MSLSTSLLNGGLTLRHLSDFVATVRRYFPTSEVVIAGGAVRDVFHQRPVKDIDVFIGVPRCIREDWHGLQKAAYALRAEMGATHLRTSDYAAGATICAMDPCIEGKPAYNFAGFRVLNINPGFRGFPTQLIFSEICDLRRDVMETFDFGICQAWVDERGMRATDAFRRDSLNRTLTRVSDDWDIDEDRFDEHRARLEAKYPKWGFRDARPNKAAHFQLLPPDVALPSNDLRPLPLATADEWWRDRH